MRSWIGLSADFGSDCFGPSDWNSHMTFLWLGGTYARNLDLFDESQATAEWTYTHMRPLGIQPPEAAVQRLHHCFHHEWDFRIFSEQWKRGPWVGPAPHPVAVLSPGRQLLYYVRHGACQDRESCIQRSKERTSVQDVGMKSLCVSCDAAMKVQWPARGEVLLPLATAPKPADLRSLQKCVDDSV